MCHRINDCITFDEEQSLKNRFDDTLTILDVNILIYGEGLSVRIVHFCNIK